MCPLDVQHQGSRCQIVQKIDQLKDQLTQLANLLQSGPLADGVEADGLDEHEVDVLREAGILPAATKKARQKARSKKRTKHIVFTEDPNAGTFHLP